MRGGGFPAIGSRERPFTTRPPTALRSTRLANSTPYANVPEAARTGLRSGMPQSDVASEGSEELLIPRGCSFRKRFGKNPAGCGRGLSDSHRARQGWRQIDRFHRILEKTGMELRPVKAQRHANVVVVQRAVRDAAALPVVFYIPGLIRQHHVPGPLGMEAVAIANFPGIAG